MVFLTAVTLSDNLTLLPAFSVKLQWFGTVHTCEIEEDALLFS